MGKVASTTLEVAATSFPKVLLGAIREMREISKADLRGNPNSIEEDKETLKSVISLRQPCPFIGKSPSLAVSAGCRFKY